MGRRRFGLWFFVVALAPSGVAPGQTASAPAASAPLAAAPATNVAAPAAAPAKKPTVDELLAARKPVPFDFTVAPMKDVVDYIAKSYDLEIVNNYPLTDRVTMQFGNLNAREAINILNSSILALGYTIVESVRGDPAHVVLTVAPIKVDAGTLVTVFYGADPDKIPEGEARRTQVMAFQAVDPQKAADTIVSVVGKQAEVSVNSSTKTIIITDTASHVHTAAALLQMLEKQAAENK
jgi:type II secretory pathway component GspD/PulD (secretin)